jgi:cell division GTPase FtsZ
MTSERSSEDLYLILGISEPATRLIKRTENELQGCEVYRNFEFEGVSAYTVGLDASDFDRLKIKKLIEPAAKLLVVVCAGGVMGAAISNFSVTEAISRGIPVDVILAFPRTWEGRKRLGRAQSLKDGLVETGAHVIEVNDNEFLEDGGYELTVGEQFALIDDVIQKKIEQWCELHAKSERL